MEANLEENRHAEDEEEYILLDLDDVCVQSDIPANASYVLSGLDTEAPILLIGDCLKLIGEYRETIGTCFLFSESDDVPEVVHRDTRPSDANISEDKGMTDSSFVPEVVHRDTRPSDANISEDKGMTDSNEEPSKQVKPIASLHKILKFRMA